VKQVTGRLCIVDHNRLVPIFCLLALFALFATACSGRSDITPDSSTFPGDPERGVQAFTSYGCISCHAIPGVPRARGLVGPPLDAWAERSFIAGQFPNSIENLTSWLMAPQAMMPGSAMPDMGVTWQDAQDMSAYLFTLTGKR
jgi:cytochrome c